MFKKRILIDLDGVLNNYNGNYDENHIPEIKQGAKDFLKNLFDKNYELHLFTTRNASSAEKWLIENNINHYFKTITNTKISAFVYIDDRAINFNGDYKQTIDNIESFKVYWK